MSDPTDNEQTTPQDVGSQTGEPTAPEGQAGITESSNNAQGESGKGDISDATPDEHRAVEEPDTFPRSVVEDLRKENATYRTKAKDRDELAAALWTARVEATGRLADPTDLPLPEDVDPLDVEVVTAAVEDLLARKPHLASRRPRGDVGQGVSGRSESLDLAGLLRGRA